VNLKLYDETMQEDEADMNRFKEIAEAQLRHQLSFEPTTHQ
jgi:hypothetical protein